MTAPLRRRSPAPPVPSPAMGTRLLVLVGVLAGAGPPAFAAGGNKAPTARDASFHLDEDATLTEDLSADDADRDSLSFTIARRPRNGDATITKTGRLTYTPKKNWHGTDELGFEVSDGKAKVARKVTITVRSVNDAPTPGPAVDLAGEEDKPVKGQASGIDIDGDRITYSLGDEPARGTVQVDAKTGRFQLTPAPNDHGTVKFSIQLSDADGPMPEAKVPVTVVLAPANDPPKPREDTAKGKEDEVLKGRLIADDIDKDPLTWAVGEQPAHGQVDIDAQKGTFSFTPAKDYRGSDAFTFVVSDGKASAKGRMAVELVNVNDPPSASPLMLEGVEDQPVEGKVLAKDSDGDEVYFTVKTDPPRGEADIDRSTGKLTYVPPPNFSGSVTFSVEASDIGGGAVVPVQVTVKPVNDAPVATSDAVRGDEDQPIEGKLRANDVDKDKLTWALAREPKNGTVEIRADGTFRFSPAASFHGKDTFLFEVRDGKAKDQGTIEVTVRPVNDPPRTADVKVQTSEDTPVRGTVTGTDIDGDTLTFSLGRKSKKGKVTVDEEQGSFVYTPAPNEHGADDFSVKVSDGTAEVEANVAVTIASVNDAPVAVAHENKGDEDQPIQGKMTGSDVDKDALTWALVVKPRAGAVEIDASSGVYTYKPQASFHGADGFRVEASDGKLKGAADVKLTIAPVNDAPDVKSVALQTAEENAVRGAVAATDIDKDKLTWSLGKAPAKGKAEVDAATGRIAYLPNPNENGDDSFVVVVADGTAKSEAAVSVVIQAVNDAPVAAAQEASGNEDEPIRGQVAGSDVDEDSLTYGVTVKPRLGTVELDAKTGAYTYTPRAQVHGADSFRFEVSDGKLRHAAEVKVTVAAVNDAPDVKDVALKATEDRSASGSVPASDIDKDKLTWSLGKEPQKGKAVIDAGTGRFTYTPTTNENGDDSFVVVVSDGTAKSEGTVSIAIAPVNDPPVADAHGNRGKEDAPIQGKLTGSDLDKNVITFAATTKPRAGALQLDPSTGAYTYTPNPHFYGEDGFRLEVSDGKLRASADVKLTVEPVNDVPEPKSLAVATSEDRQVSGKVLATDIDKDVLTFRLKKPPQQGAVVLDDASGAFRFLPARDKNGPDAFVVEVTDGWASAEATVTVEIAAVPDAPMIDPLPVEASEDEPATLKLVALDADGEPVTFKILTPSRLGEAEIVGDGSTLRFVPRPDVHGEDELVVEATSGKDRTRAALPVRVAARNDAPTVDEQKATTLEETPVELAVRAHDKDGDPVKLALGDKPAGADVKLTGNVLRLVPRKDYAGPVEVTVIPSDAAGKGAVARFLVTVENVNDAPVAKDLPLQAEPEKPQSGTIEAADVDAGDELTFSLAVPPRQGAAVIDDPHTGRFTYTANANARGEDSLRIRVRDKAGASVTATVKVTLTGPKPVAAR